MFHCFIEQQDTVEKVILKSSDDHNFSFLKAVHTVEDNLTSGRDFETLVMRKLRQAEERKRLCEQIANEDGEES